MFKVSVNRTFTDGTLKGITLRDFYIFRSDAPMAIGDSYEVTKSAITPSPYRDVVVSLVAVSAVRNARVPLGAAVIAAL